MFALEAGLLDGSYWKISMIYCRIYHGAPHTRSSYRLNPGVYDRAIGWGEEDDLC